MVTLVTIKPQPPFVSKLLYPGRNGIKFSDVPVVPEAGSVLAPAVAATPPKAPAPPRDEKTEDAKATGAGETENKDAEPEKPGE